MNECMFWSIPRLVMQQDADFRMHYDILVSWPPGREFHGAYHRIALRDTMQVDRRDNRDRRRSMKVGGHHG